jgi:plastocyanin
MPHRPVLLLALLVFALTAAAAGNARPAKSTFDLKGEVYANFKIEMKNSTNKPLKTVKAGVHTIKVEDMSSIHDFHLVGPGVNKSTTVGGVGERLWTVRLKPGKYTFFCDAHAGTMRGSFRVTG